MRVIAFTGLSLLGYLYGAYFDLVISDLGDGAYCDLLRAVSCPLAREADRWITQIALLFVLPGAGLFLISGLARRPRLAGAGTALGILLVVPGA